VSDIALVPVEVECRSEYTYAQEPRAVWWYGERDPVTVVLRAWVAPKGRGFRVRTAAGAHLELYYVEADDAWWARPLPP